MKDEVVDFDVPLLHIYSYLGIDSLVKKLLSVEPRAVNDTRYRIESPLAYAVRGGHQAAVRLLLEHGANVNSGAPSFWSFRPFHGRTALIHAAFIGHEAMARVLLEHGADANVRDEFEGRTALCYAVGRGHVAMVRLLLENGADVNAETGNVIHGRGPAVELPFLLSWLMLDYRTNEEHEASRRHSTALTDASRMGNNTAVELLLAHGAEVKARDHDGMSAMKWAVLFGHEAVVELLRVHGANMEEWRHG